MNNRNTFKHLESNVQSYARAYPSIFKTAHGAQLRDELVHYYLDFLAGAGSLNYGDNNPVLKRALIEHIMQDEITHSLDLHTEAYFSNNEYKDARTRMDEHFLIDQASLSAILGITINQIQALVRDRVFWEASAGHFQLAQTIQAWSAYLCRCYTSNGKIGQRKKTNDTPVSPCLEPNKFDYQRIDNNRGDPAGLYTPLGITEFDRKYGGIVCDAINIVEAADQDSSIAALGHYISSGLEKGERVAFVSFENPRHALAKLEQYGFGSFDSYLKKEQLIYIYYKPLFTKSLCLSFDYRRLFEEIDRIGGQEITRLAFDNCEVLFNLQSVPLAMASAIKLLSVTENKKYTTLGSYIRRKESDQKNLIEACESTIISYITIDRCEDNETGFYETGFYQFTVRKSLNMATENKLKLKLLKQQGFVETFKPMLVRQSK